MPTAATHARLIFGGSYYESPSWSPDGTQIAFQSDRDGNWNIYVMAADGSNLSQLTSHNAWDESPSWSPDGTQIAFHSYRDNNWDIYVIDADGSNLRVDLLATTPLTGSLLGLLTAPRSPSTPAAMAMKRFT